jgi:membrane-associated protease RseP (regulator of RpoE activity)
MNPPPVPPVANPPATSSAEPAASTSVPTESMERDLTAEDLGTRPRSRVGPLLLFFATCFFTYAAGCYEWRGNFFGTDYSGAWNPEFVFNRLALNWRDGLLYMGSVMTILICHEMGHFLMTVRYRVPASYPIFLPMPMMLTGTLGAVIGMEGLRANRKQLFDIGIAGPLAGLIPTVAFVWIGVRVAAQETPNPGEPMLGIPLLLQWMFSIVRPDLIGKNIGENPYLMAGWVGMLITGLNMMPISQLDGGHTIYALFLQRAHGLARAFLLLAMAAVVIYGLYTWTIMLVLVTLMGVDHPPTSNDNMPLGLIRTTIGLLSLAIPVLCFTPVPIS